MLRYGRMMFAGQRQRSAWSACRMACGRWRARCPWHGRASARQHFSQDCVSAWQSDPVTLGGGGAAESAVSALCGEGLLRGQTTVLPTVRPAADRRRRPVRARRGPLGIHTRSATKLPACVIRRLRLCLLASSSACVFDGCVTRRVRIKRRSAFAFAR